MGCEDRGGGGERAGRAGSFSQALRSESFRVFPMITRASTHAHTPVPRRPVCLRIFADPTDWPTLLLTDQLAPHLPALPAHAPHPALSPPRRLGRRPWRKSCSVPWSASLPPGGGVIGLGFLVEFLVKFLVKFLVESRAFLLLPRVPFFAPWRGRAGRRAWLVALGGAGEEGRRAWLVGMW